jgi:hypothetical protein
MDATEKTLELMQVICRLHRSEQHDESDAVQMLRQEGFENVSVELVRAVYDQLEKEADKRTKIYHDNAENKLYYAFINDSYMSPCCRSAISCSMILNRLIRMFISSNCSICSTTSLCNFLFLNYI